MQFNRTWRFISWNAYSYSRHNLSLPRRIEFDGALTPNRLLQSAIYFGHAKFRGAESIVFVNSTMYAGLLNGQIARFDSQGNLHAVTQVIENFDRRSCGIL